MKSFRVRIAQGWKAASAMILPPLLILPGIYFLAQIRGLPEAVVIAFIAIMVVSLCGVSIWLVLRGITLVDYLIEGGRHRVEVLRKTWLTVRSFDFSIGEVTSFQVRRSGNRLYFTITMRGYPGKFSINAASDRPEDVGHFKELILLIASQLDLQRVLENEPERELR